MAAAEGTGVEIGIVDDNNVNDVRVESFRDDQLEEESLLVEPKQQQSRRRSSAMEEDEFYPMSFQEELNEILEAFYAAVSEEDIREYQRFIESNFQRSIAEGALHAISKAPDFDLEDQDGDKVTLSDFYKKGPVVLIFYRGKWCPHCNATILAMSRQIENIKAKGATLIAISPMLPDGTKYLATKRSLDFPVCSDVGNVVARKYNLTFQINPEFWDSLLRWGDDVPGDNGDDSWEVPLPATYIIDTNGDVIWSFVDNDPSVRASPEEILAFIPCSEVSPSGKNISLGQDQVLVKEGAGRRTTNRNTKKRLVDRRHLSSTFKTKFKSLFGKNKQTPREFLSNYLLPPN
jgi:peroxiredoxin